VFLNFLAYALFSPTVRIPDSRRFASFVATINAGILFAVGLATLIPPERLKIWWRKRETGEASLFCDDGLPWPWLALSAVVAYGLMVWGLFAWQGKLGSAKDGLASGAVQLLVVLIFVTRDVLFIQWCKLTGLRSPLLKGTLYLGLYYVAALVLAIVFGVQSDASAQRVVDVFTPVGIFDPRSHGFHYPISVFLGMVLQLALIGLLLIAIAIRLKRPAVIPALATG
jgi:hypothetical protein